MAAHLTRGVRYEKKEQAWKLFLAGINATRIANHLSIDVKTVRLMVLEKQREIGEERKRSGEAEADLNRYIGGMRQQRSRASNLYQRSMKRLEREEKVELEHEALRASQGKLPTTDVTRALEFHMRGLPVAIKAIDTCVKTTEAEGRVLGLEALGKEEAKRNLEANLAEFLVLLTTPVEITIKEPDPTPPFWDEPDESDEFE